MDNNMIDEFVEITGGTRSQAEQHIAAAAGNFEMAVESYFSGNQPPLEADDEAPFPVPVPRAAAPPARSSGNTLSGAASTPMPTNWSTRSSGRGTPINNPIRSNQPARVSTLSDLDSSRSAPAPSRANNDSDDEGEQAEFFTGGEKSGLSVENPNAGRKSNSASDMIKGILQKAKDASGASAPSAAPAQSRSIFGGTAHTLGSDDTPSVQVGGPTARASALPGSFPSSQMEEDDEKEEVAVRNLTFWEDGFSIEDGDLMRYTDPGNDQILAAINNGRAPLALLKVRNDQPVELRIAKRLNEKWVRGPSLPKGPWEGSGNRLGSEVPAGVEVTTLPAASQSEGTSFIPENVFEIDSNQPVTTLQLRLRSGERLITRFNHTHTIGDIRRYINAAQPGQGASFYALQTTFPSKDLEDESQTIKDAGILGSVIVQRSI